MIVVHILRLSQPQTLDVLVIGVVDDLDELADQVGNLTQFTFSMTVNKVKILVISRSQDIAHVDFQCLSAEVLVEYS